MMGWGGCGGYGMGIAGSLFILVFWGLIIVGLVLVVRWLWDHGRSGTGAGVGDTPLDIAAAEANGARSVAVATGFFSVDELTAAGAGLVFPDFSSWQAVLDALLG